MSEDLFRRLSKKREIQRPKNIDLGNTAAGAAQLGAKPLESGFDKEFDPSKFVAVREYGPFRGHASKRHGKHKNRGVRKVGVEWR